MSKVDPKTLGLGRRATLLLDADRPTRDAEKGEVSAIEEPGIDAIRGGLGVIGSIVRARSLASSRGTIRSRRAAHGHSRDDSVASARTEVGRLPSLSGLQRHQLFDNPVPPLPEDAAERISMYSNVVSPRVPKKHQTTIQFRESDLAGHDHEVTEQEGREAELALDDFIQRTASPGTATATVTSTRQLYDDPYAQTSPGASKARYDPFSLRQDSLASLPEGGRESLSPDGAESPPRSGGRFQRSYPHNPEIDREESMSLVHGREMGYEHEREEQSTLERHPGMPDVSNGGIRLVPSLPRR